MMRRRLGVLTLLVATFTGPWSMGMAATEPVEPRLVLTDVGSTAATPIQIERMYPGVAVTRPYVMQLTATAPAARLALEVDELVDLERGCNHPESTSGDDSCDELDGELSQQLLVSAALTESTDCQATEDATAVLAPTPLVEIAETGVVEIDGLLGSGTQRCLLLTFDLPRSADNLVQTDLARFDLVVHAEQAFPNETGTEGEGDDTEVGGVSTERPAPIVSAPTGVGPNLPVTGVGLGLLLAFGLGGLAAGSLALRASRRSQPAPGDLDD